MACPFSRDLSKGPGCDEQAARRDNDRSRIVRLGRGDSGRSRQSSFEVTSLLMREETEDAEDTQTLNLKHLRAAVLILTNPSVYRLRLFLFSPFFPKHRSEITNWNSRKSRPLPLAFFLFFFFSFFFFFFFRLTSRGNRGSRKLSQKQTRRNWGSLVARRERGKRGIYATSAGPVEFASSFDKFFIKLENSIFHVFLPAPPASLVPARNYYIPKARLRP